MAVGVAIRPSCHARLLKSNPITPGDREACGAFEGVADPPEDEPVVGEPDGDEEPELVGAGCDAGAASCAGVGLGAGAGWGSLADDCWAAGAGLAD